MEISDPYNSLLKRNKELIHEINRLKSENKKYKLQIGEFNKKELKLKICITKSTQTINDDNKSNILLSTRKKNCQINSRSFSPITPYRTPIKLIKRPYHYSCDSSERNSSPPAIQIKLLKHKKYRYNMTSTNQQEEEEKENKNNEENVNRSNWGDNSDYIDEVDNDEEKDDNKNLKQINQKEFDQIGSENDDICSIVCRISFSPVVTPKATQSSRRRTRIPVSYKEPALNTKIRKGHQFFKYTERS